MSAPIIEISNLSKSFGTHHVLRGIDFSVQPSLVVVIIGPSGSGKSTFLRCMNGLETAEGGTLVACGHTVVEQGRMMSDEKLDALRSEVGMVFQSFNLFPHLTVLENITLAPMSRRLTVYRPAAACGRCPRPDRHQKNHILAFRLHLIDNFFAMPVYALHDVFRITYCQFSHHHHRLRRGGKHFINDVFAFSFRRFRQAIQQIDLSTTSGTFGKLSCQTPQTA